MLINLLVDFRGRLTNEKFYQAGEHDLPDEMAKALIADGRAEAMEETPKSEPKPEPAKPTRRRKATKKTS